MVGHAPPGVDRSTDEQPDDDHDGDRNYALGSPELRNDQQSCAGATGRD
jgi:hypothetical protein